MEILRENLHSADKSLAEANSRNEILREFKNSCTRIYQQNMHIQQTMENVNTTVRSINKDRSGGLIEASEMIRKVEERQEDSWSNMIKATKVIMGFMDKKTTEFAHYCNQAGVLPPVEPRQRVQSTSSSAKVQSTSSSTSALRSAAITQGQGTQPPLQPPVDPNNRLVPPARPLPLSVYPPGRPLP
jgi:hypothetical protein